MRSPCLRTASLRGFLPHSREETAGDYNFLIGMNVGDRLQMCLWELGTCSGCFPASSQVCSGTVSSFSQQLKKSELRRDTKRKLLAELVEDEKVAMEIARLEEEFRRLTEENRNLVTVHNERAQQLERLCLTDQRRQDSS
ncbi:uncharacterized protein map3k7cl isoform X3 [Lates calcarifer]|uniref:Uncharacterized protein map3k7cl isoform X3 n=1 Tax=Lates calcarifer TaxID=8187 RepID=A0AAJ8BMB1_LATCA|nr:uncharacterized protein map3k7cl isoform X3 [Lates calcarifer]